MLPTDGSEVKHVPTLDGWRAIAVMLVIVCHGSFLYYPSLLAWQSSRWYSLSVGVDIFFVLSGIVITTSLLRDEQLYGAISLRAFYIRRAFRILPVLTVLLVALGALRLFQSREEILASCFFFRNFLPPGSGPQTDHLWSLSVEEQFYLFWPLLLLVARRHAIKILAVLIFLVPLYRLMACVGGWVKLEQTQYIIDGLLIGCLIALLLPLRSAGLRIRFPATLGTIALVLVSVLVYWGKYRVGSLTFLPVLIACMLVGTVLQPTYFLGRLLEWAPLRAVGRASYAIYSWQEIFLSLLPIGGIGVRLTCIAACAAISHYVIERPMQNFGRRLAQGALGSRFAAPPPRLLPTP